MRNNGWARLDWLMRSLHLYTGLFLVPWIMVYAASAFCLNHHHWFIEHFQVTPARMELLRQVDFVPDDSFPETPPEQARAILQLLDLDGPHGIQARSPAGEMIINRLSGSGHYRITWRRRQSRIVVHRQQPFSLYRLMHFLHFRLGYGQPYFACIAWAVVVDGVAVCMCLWVVSGIYLWARRPRRRLLGGVCLVAGILLFLGLTVLLCR